MSNLEEIRTRLRSGAETQPGSGGSSVPILLLLAICGIAIGFAALWLMPHVSSKSLYSLVDGAKSFWR
jgi:hypothetical protein